MDELNYFIREVNRVRMGSPPFHSQVGHWQYSPCFWENKVIETFKLQVVGLICQGHKWHICSCLLAWNLLFVTLSKTITFKLESVLYQDAGLEKEHSLRLLEHLSVALGEQQAGSRAQQAHLLCGGGCGDIPGAVSGAGTRRGSRCSCSSWGPAPLQQSSQATAGVRECQEWAWGARSALWESHPAGLKNLHNGPLDPFCVTSSFCPHRARTKHSKQRWKQVGQGGRWEGRLQCWIKWSRSCSQTHWNQ